MSQKKQFRAQKAKATTKASKSARLPSTEKNAVFTLTGTFQKAKPDKAPGFHFFTEKLSAFRLQRPSRKQNRIKRPVFHVFTEKLSAFRLPEPSRKRNRTKRPAFTSSRKNFRLSAHRDLPESETGQSARLSLLHGKTFGFPLTGTFAKAKPDKAVKRQSGYYGCRKLHKRAEKLGVQVRKCYLSILSMLIKASEGIDTEPT